MDPRGGSHVPVSVNVLGDWRATTGLAEAARRSVSAMVATGARVSLHTRENPEVPRSASRFPAALKGLEGGRIGDIDVWYLNVHEFNIVPDSDLRPGAEPRYVVGSWAWELPRLAHIFEPQLERVDEIWVPSRFTAEAFRHHTTKPVRVMPIPVEPLIDLTLSRSDLGLPEEGCLFLFSFDVNSTMARKNPRAVIQAFEAAFDAVERHGPVRLVMKTSNLDSSGDLCARLADEVASVGGVLIDGELSRQEMDSLIGLCDIYVSLHRAEGFGMGMAEAMALGRPVIATAYSGNTDFMTAANSAPVRFRLRPITKSDHVEQPSVAPVYEPGQFWAEPDVGHAAEWMRRLWRDPSLRNRIGRAAAAAVRERYNHERVSAEMLTRLWELSRGRGDLEHPPERPLAPTDAARGDSHPGGQA